MKELQNQQIEMMLREYFIVKRQHLRNALESGQFDNVHAVFASHINEIFERQAVSDVTLHMPFLWFKEVLRLAQPQVYALLGRSTIKLDEIGAHFQRPMSSIFRDFTFDPSIIYSPSDLRGEGFSKFTITDSRVVWSIMPGNDGLLSLHRYDIPTDQFGTVDFMNPLTTNTAKIPDSPDFDHFFSQPDKNSPVSTFFFQHSVAEFI